MGTGPQGIERGKKVGGDRAGEVPPPQEQHAAAEQNHHHDGNCGMLRAIRWVKINTVQLREFLEPKKSKRFEGGGWVQGEDERAGGRGDG